MGDPQALAKLNEAGQQVTGWMLHDLRAEVVGIVEMLLEVACPIEWQSFDGGGDNDRRTQAGAEGGSQHRPAAQGAPADRSIVDHDHDPFAHRAEPPETLFADDLLEL